MIFQVDSNNVIISYAEVGFIDGRTIEIQQYIVDEFDESIKTPTGLVPLDFQDKFLTRLYMVVRGEVVNNPDYVPDQKIEIPKPPVTNEELQIAIAELAELIMELKSND